VTGDPRFHELLRQIGELHDKKQLDYGADQDPFANVRASERWGIEPWVGALVRLNDKVHRLQQFAKKGELANESAEDSMLDIAVYSLIALILYREADERAALAGLERLRQMGEEDRARLTIEERSRLEEWRTDLPSLIEDFEEISGQEVGAPTEPFKHAPCLSCQTEGYETAGQDPALD
jgi:hypothetical protein